VRSAAHAPPPPPTRPAARRRPRRKRSGRAGARRADRLALRHRHRRSRARTRSRDPVAAPHAPVAPRPDRPRRPDRAGRHGDARPAEPRRLAARGRGVDERHGLWGADRLARPRRSSRLPGRRRRLLCGDLRGLRRPRRGGHAPPARGL
ncbi:MAG: hypothetical protein AVDCRST_MAG17-1468, partial [uncultured Solirubrobacterales bacterium]